jgi:TolB-like protein/Tfp pilus assembly protein PilF
MNRPNPSDEHGVLSGLGRWRHSSLVRWGFAYGAAAWVLLQALSLLAGVYGWPAWVMRLAVALSLTGFFVTLVLAWYHGERGAKHLSRPELALLATIVAIGAGGVWLSESRQASPTAAASPATPSATATTPAPATPAPTAAAAPPRAIAVLPFRNLSDDRNDGYFAEGIAEELLNRLAHLPDLHVAGRTSSFSFRDKSTDLRSIAKQLGVFYLLEGSVRRSGNQVRVTTQLIRADTGFEVWSETYDRELKDIFAVQDEISAAIIDALRVNMAGGAADFRPTANVSMNAYQAYLKGQSLMSTRRPGSLQAARAELQASIAIAPDYAPALTALARTDLLIPMWSQLTSEAVRKLTEEATQMARRALSIDPNDARAHAVLGTIHSNSEWRWDEAEREFALALQLAPNDAEVLNFAGDFYRILLDEKRMMATELKALKLNPLAIYNHSDLAWASLALGRYEDAIKYAHSARDIDPELIDTNLILVWSYGKLGRIAEVRRTVLEARERARGSEPQHLLLDSWAAIAEGRRAQALALQARLEPYVARGEYSSGLLGYNLLLLGDAQGALKWLERGYQERDLQLVYQEPVNLGEVGRNPVTRALLERPGLRELVEIRRSNGRYP